MPKRSLNIPSFSIIGFQDKQWKTFSFKNINFGVLQTGLIELETEVLTLKKVLECYNINGLLLSHTLFISSKTLSRNDWPPMFCRIANRDYSKTNKVLNVYVY